MLLIADILFILLISFYLTYLLSNKIPHKGALFLVLFATIFLHELAHKAVASYFGYVSYIIAEGSFYFLIVTTVMYLLTGLIVPPPIYTSIFAKKVENGIMYYPITNILEENALHIALIAIAGPIVNLLLALISFIIIKRKLYDTEFEEKLFKIMLQINTLIFIVNIFPIIPGNDGSIFMEALEVLLK